MTLGISSSPPHLKHWHTVFITFHHCPSVIWNNSKLYIWYCIIASPTFERLSCGWNYPILLSLLNLKYCHSVCIVPPLFAISLPSMYYIVLLPLIETMVICIYGIALLLLWHMKHCRREDTALYYCLCSIWNTVCLFPSLFTLYYCLFANSLNSKQIIWNCITALLAFEIEFKRLPSETKNKLQIENGSLGRFYWDSSLAFETLPSGRHYIMLLYLFNLKRRHYVCIVSSF